MRIKLNRRALLAIYVILTSLLCFYFWPTDIAKLLEKKLKNLSEQVTSTEPLNAIGARIKAKELIDILADKIHVEYRTNEDEFISDIDKEEILNHLTVALVRARDIKAGFSRFRLLTSDKDRAKIAVFLIAEWREPPQTELFRAAEDLRIEFKKVEGEWLIDKVEALPRITL
jgi:hypothetical protein